MVREEQVGCSWCGKRLDGNAIWIGLNRWVVRTRNNTSFMTNVDSDTKEYVWSPENRDFSGFALCYPHCLMTWIEGEVIECGRHG